MARTFVMHDGSGGILAVASIEAMPDGQPHPFVVDDPSHQVVEVAPDDAALASGIERVHETHSVDPVSGALAPASGPPAAKRRPPSRKPPTR
jgi:hypothetical protein